MESAKIYRSFRDAAKQMPDDERLKFWDALMDYALDGEEPDIDGIAGIVFTAIRPTIDSYTESASQGTKGGRPKKGGSEKQKRGVSENKKGGSEKSKTYEEVEAEVEADTEADTEAEKEAEAEEHKNHKARKRAEVVYDPDPEVNEAVKEFIRHRRVLKKPMTDYAVDRFLAKLRGMSRDPTEQVRLINTAIEHGWQTVYEDKKPEGKIDWSTV